MSLKPKTTYLHAQLRAPATKDAAARVETVGSVQNSVGPGARATAMLKQNVDNMPRLRQKIARSMSAAGKFSFL